MLQKRAEHLDTLAYRLLYSALEQIWTPFLLQLSFYYRAQLLAAS